MPDTFGYYVAAYLVAGVLIAGYVASLAQRARRFGSARPEAAPRP